MTIKTLFLEYIFDFIRMMTSSDQFELITVLNKYTKYIKYINEFMKRYECKINESSHSTVYSGLKAAISANMNTYMAYSLLFSLNFTSKNFFSFFSWYSFISLGRLKSLQKFSSNSENMLIIIGVLINILWLISYIFKISFSFFVRKLIMFVIVS